MTEQVGSATASGSLAGPGSGAARTGQTAMAAQPGGGQVAPFVSQVPGTPVTFPTFHGRRVSWVAVSLIMVAFVIGGVALVIGPTWWLFWAAAGLSVLGLLLALGTGIFDDWY